MTIATEAIVAGPFTGNGVASSFSFAFKVFTDSDVLVEHTALDGVDDTSVLNDNYIVVRNANQDVDPGGEIFWRVAGVTVPLPAGEKVTITSQVPKTQQTALPTGGDYSAKTVERMIDKGVMLAKQNARDIERAIRQPVTDAILMGELPPAALRAEKFVTFDSLGRITVGAFITSDTPVSPYMASVLLGEDSAEAKTLLDITEGVATAYMLTLFAAENALEARTILDIQQFFGVAASDETTALTTGAGKVKFRFPPYACTLIDVSASLSTAQASGATLVTVDVNEEGTSLLSTKLTFDNTEKTTVTATTPRVISDAAIAANAEGSIDVDNLQGGSVAAGLKVWFTLQRAS